MIPGFVAQALSAVPTASPPSSGIANAVVAAVSLAAGVAVGTLLLLTARNAFRRKYQASQSFASFCMISEKVLPFLAGVLAGAGELFKRHTFQTADSLTHASFGVEGALLALSFLVPWLIATSKEREKQRIAALTTEIQEVRREYEQRMAGLDDQLAVTTLQRDRIMEVIAGFGAALAAKKERLWQLLRADAQVKPQDLTTALGPSVQIFNLIRSLHQHFARRIAAPSKLRVGVYMRSPDDPQTLAALYSYDGQNEGCFSNRHPEMMRLDSPGGARSLIVQCYHSGKKLHIIPDCAEAARQEDGGFVFFSERQRQRIKSILAYQYVLQDSENQDALILTMDTDVVGFFSQAGGYEYRLILEGTANRIELELAALNLIKKFDPTPTHERPTPA